jgi:hypothetical protein
MEKKGDLLNQLAIISDLLENINLEVKSRTIVFEQSKKDFEDTFELIQKKHNHRLTKPKNSFSINIGVIDVVFNMSNV